MRTEQEYRNLDEENASLRERLEKAETDAERYRWMRRWKGQEHEPLFTVQHEIDGIMWGCDLDSAIDAAIKAQQADEIERELTARKTAQESLEQYKGECTRLQHEVDRLKGEGAVDQSERT